MRSVFQPPLLRIYIKLNHPAQSLKLVLTSLVYFDQGSSGGFDTGGEDMNPEPVEPPPAKKHKNLYDSFVTARDREERGLAAVGDTPGSSGLTSGRAANPDRPRHGNTVYVSGYEVDTNLCQNKTPFKFVSGLFF